MQSRNNLEAITPLIRCHIKIFTTEDGSGHPTRFRSVNDLITRIIVTGENHCPEGGLGEAVAQGLSADLVPMLVLAVGKTPRSGTPDELFEYNEISWRATTPKIKEVL